MRPRLLSIAPVAVMLLTPVPLCTISPAWLLKVVALRVMFFALLLALFKLTAPAVNTSAPLLMICPRWPLKAPALATVMASVPLPVCSILPSVLLKPPGPAVCSVKLWPLLAMRPEVLFKSPTTAMVVSPVPV